jgi:acetyltransferase-like isoleucine patch superfamily enzyme
MKRIFRYLRKKHIAFTRDIRTFFWSQLFGSFGRGSSIVGSITVRDPENVHIGSNSVLGAWSILNARGAITIGNMVIISARVTINTGGLDYTKKGVGRKRHTKAPVTLCDGVWIGSGAIINPGVTIGENSVVGAVSGYQRRTSKRGCCWSSCTSY